MIIHLDSRIFAGEASVAKRLEALELRLRRMSDGGMRLGDYADWLEESRLPLPSRQTLRLDVERYAQSCDDLVYGEHRKALRIDEHAQRDAVRYFLGEPWLDSPLQPRLSSSACRCLLLAMHLGEEVEFSYEALPRPGLMAGFKIHRGIPLRTLPGSDSGYMAIRLEQGTVMPINLARVTGRVAMTGRSVSDYLPLPPDPEILLCMECPDEAGLRRGRWQFSEARATGQTLHFAMPASLATMSADMLEAWWRRTAMSPRLADRSIDLPNGRVTIQLKPKES